MSSFISTFIIIEGLIKVSSIGKNRGYLVTSGGGRVIKKA